MATQEQPKRGLPNPQRYNHPEHGLLPKVFIVYAHNPSEYSQIAPPNIQEVLQANPQLTEDDVWRQHEDEVVRHDAQEKNGITESERMVERFALFLQESHIAVAYDLLLRDTGADNVMKWAQEQIEDSDYVILIISPSFRNFLEGKWFFPFEQEPLFSGHYLYNLVNSPRDVRLLPVFLNRLKDSTLLPKALEASTTFEVFEPFNVHTEDLRSLYGILTKQRLNEAPKVPTIVKLKPRKNRCKYIDLSQLSFSIQKLRISLPPSKQ